MVVRGFTQNGDVVVNDPAAPSDTAVRIASPFTHLVRTATSDHELHGQQIKEGDIVLMLFAAGNFDERAFDDPNTFDLARLEAPAVVTTQTLGAPSGGKPPGSPRVERLWRRAPGSA